MEDVQCGQCDGRTEPAEEATAIVSWEWVAHGVKVWTNEVSGHLL
jgi:hypothetical protein